MSTVEVFTQAGYPLGEVVTDAAREWVINGYGGRSAVARCQFTISVRETPTWWFEYGNLILVRHNALPWWGGVIEPDRDSGDGKMTITAYSAEQMLAKRRGAEVQKLEGTPGDYFLKALEIANSQGDTLIRPGSVFRNEPAGKKEYDFSNILEGINAIASEAKREWEVVPVLDAGGRLSFVANWYERQGQKLDRALEDGKHIEKITRLAEQGTIINDLEGVGDGSTEANRPRVVLRDEVSIGRYGLHQGRENFSAKNVALLEPLVAARLKETAYPRKVMDFAVANVGGCWRWLRAGNTLGVHTITTNVWVITQARLVGMGVDEARGLVDVTMDEVRE